MQLYINFAEDGIQKEDIHVVPSMSDSLCQQTKLLKNM